MAASDGPYDRFTVHAVNRSDHRALYRNSLSTTEFKFVITDCQNKAIYMCRVKPRGEKHILLYMPLVYGGTICGVCLRTRRKSHPYLKAGSPVADDCLKFVPGDTWRGVRSPEHTKVG